MTHEAKRALLVIDVQNEYLTGGLRIEYPDPQLSLRNIARAMDVARELRVPIVVVQNSAPESSPLFAKGSTGWELHPTIRERSWDHYIEKSLPSAFAGTDLSDFIARHGIDTLSVVGYMTHNCVDSTVKHALHAGLAVECLHDATGSVPYANRAGRANAEQIHQTFCIVMQSRFAAVLSCEDWVRACRAGVKPARDTIYGSYQAAAARG